MDIEEVARIVVDSAIRVHKKLGPGLLESAYQACLAFELRESGLDVKCEVTLPLRYGPVDVDAGYRIDMLVERQIVVENKVVERIVPIHTAQLLTYLRLSECRVGFILNWNVVLMKDGIRRYVNRL